MTLIICFLHISLLFRIIHISKKLRNISLHTSDFKVLGPLTGILALTTIIATSIGIFRNEFYLDGEWINAQWLGQDLVTLLIGVPMLLIAARKAIILGSLIWELVLAGSLFYFVYIYTFFVFEANFTFLYFLHLPIFSLSLLCLVLVFHHILNTKNDYVYRHKFTRNTIVLYFTLISSMLTWLWLQDLISHLAIEEFFSQTPDGEPPLIIYTLDLGIVIPLIVIAVILLVKNHALGMVLTGIMLVKICLLGFALTAMSISVYVQDMDPDSFLIVLWALIGLSGLALVIVYLNRLEVYPRDLNVGDHGNEF